MVKKLFLATLGCPKNQVDSERTLWALRRAGVELVDHESQADIVIVNTCGFTGDAKEESIDTILELAQAKKKRPLVKLAVMGCLSERYRDELTRLIPEIDYIYGVSGLERALEDLAPGGARSSVPGPEDMDRIITTAPHWAYLKIAEGCSNKCSFCVIPAIRGPYNSRPPEAVVKEAESLARLGVKELSVVAQDTTLYGTDIRIKGGLVTLLRHLSQIDGIEWIRVMYMYPTLLNETLLKFMSDAEKVAPYFDIPLQHASDRVLKNMIRPETNRSIRGLIDSIRKFLPESAIRTSFIVGFPGEMDNDFENLIQLVEETRFDHLGAFIYSPEEGSEAFNLPGRVDNDTARERYNRLMETQRSISHGILQAKIGGVEQVMVDGLDLEENLLTGRMITQAPQIDGSVILDRVEAEPGDIVTVKLTGSLEYDLIGEPHGRSCE